MSTWETRVLKLAESTRLQMEIIGREQAEDSDFSIYALSSGGVGLPTALVAAGVHGDEPETVEAALQLLEAIATGVVSTEKCRLVILPCLNPSGMVEGTRTNASGQDINRQFHSGLTPVTSAVRRYIPTVGVEMLIDLHADRTTTGFYFFELLAPNVRSLALRVRQAVTLAGFALEESPFYAGLRGEKGLIAPTESQMVGFERAAPGASLAQWAWQSGIPRSYVFEAPQSTDGQANVQMLLTALRALFGGLAVGS